ncbi:MAG: hypothetical protein K2W96_25010 [Gemmataceae bacterium]|nr:hypothetical protein [Gemmataceae bacterium]
MDHRVIREALTTQPFQPFRLRMNDGRSFDTFHPDWLLVGPNGRYVIHNDQLNDGKITTLEPLLIASLEHIPPLPPPQAPNNGQARS